MVLGASGMLGHMLSRVLAARPGVELLAVVRDREQIPALRALGITHCCVLPDSTDISALSSLLKVESPAVLVNCVSVARELMQLPQWAFPVYSVLPQRAALLCRLLGIRMIQIGSDGVFSGSRGNYVETDMPDPIDVYGTAKYLGEVDGPGAITLRLSMIGPQLRGRDGLLEWVRHASGSCQGYSKSIFSGLPTTEIARVMAEYVIPNPDLCGIFHVAARPISKYELLLGIADAYGLDLEIVRDDSVVMDRSLCAERFRKSVGYEPPDWPELLRVMSITDRGREGK